MSDLEYGVNVANKFDLLFGDEDPTETLSKSATADPKKKKDAKDAKPSSTVLKEKVTRSAKPEDNKSKDKKGEGKPQVQKKDARNVPAGTQQRPPRSAGQGGRADGFGKENATKPDQQRSPAGGASGGPRRYGGPRPDGSAPVRRDQDFGGMGGDQEVPEQRVGFGGGRGFRGGHSHRGAPRHYGTRDAGTENQHARGREFERHSGSNKTGVKPIQKREGGGAHNWGSYRDEAEMGTEAVVTTEKKEGEEGAAPEGAVTENVEVAPAVEEEPVKTLKEWMEEEERNRARPKFAVRAANDGEQEQKVFGKMKRVQRENTTADGMVEVVEYVEVDVDGKGGKAGGLGGPFQLVFAPASRPTRESGGMERGERGGRGGPGRGRGGPRGGGFSGGRGGQRGGFGGRKEAPPAADELNFPPLG